MPFSLPLMLSGLKVIVVLGLLGWGIYGHNTKADYRVQRDAALAENKDLAAKYAKANQIREANEQKHAEVKAELDKAYADIEKHKASLREQAGPKPDNPQPCPAHCTLP